MNSTASQTPKPMTIARDSVALAALFAASQGASAQTAPQQASAPGGSDNEILPETVVKSEAENAYNAAQLSSLKATAPLLNTPQTTTVIPKEVFTQQGARNLTDVLKNTPGISYNAGENGFGTNQNNFSLRGTDTTGSIYVDGFRDSGSYSRDIFNLERVEIVKGAAADNGRGTAGGYVNLVSKTPGLENAYSGSTSYAADETDASGRFRTSVDINQVIDGALPGTAFRLNAFLQEGGIAGRNIAEANAWGVAPSISFGLGTDTRLTLSYQHVRQNDIPDWGVNSGVTTNRGFGNVTRVGRDIFHGLTSDYDDTSSNAFLAVIEHDFTSGLKLSNHTRITKTDREADFTMPFGYEDATKTTFRQQRVRYDRENFSFGNQTNLVYEFETGSLKHTLATGLEYSHEKSEANRFGSTNRTGVSASNPNNNPTGFPVPAYGGTGEVTIDTIAAYVFDTVEINEQFQLTGGLRLEHYRAELEGRDALGAIEAANTFDKSDTTLGGKLGLIYKPAENGSIYGSIGVSAMPPGSLLSNADASREGDNGFPGAGAGINNRNASTQMNWNYEIGTKWDFYDGRLSTTAAVFHTVRTDVAISDGRGNMIGEGDQTLSGIELGVAGQITDEWNVFAGFLAMTTERDHFNDFRDAGGRPAIGGQNINGDELAFAPNYSANLFTTYRFPIGLTIGGGMQYVGSSYLGRPDDAERIIPNGTYGKIPDYLTFNALLAYEINPNVTIRFNVDNVFDEVYAVSSNWSGVRSLVGPARTYTISADWSF